jgi:hypothetical protein
MSSAVCLHRATALEYIVAIDLFAKYFCKRFACSMPLGESRTGSLPGRMFLGLS